MRASGEITAASTTATVAFGDVSFVVAISHFHWPNGGGWSFFVCPCGHRCRTLRLYEGRELACNSCLRARGFLNKVSLIATSDRAGYHAPRIIPRLTSPSPARLYPRNGQKLDRRFHLEAQLRRSVIVARQHAVDEHDERLGKLMRDRK